MRYFDLALALPLLIAACSAAGAETAECSKGSDCSSGVCSTDGTCVQKAGSGGAGAGGDAGAGGLGGGAGAGGDAGAGGSGASGAGAGNGGSSGVTCKPNGDGTITKDEMPIAAGLTAKYSIAQNAPVSTAGTMQGSKKTWDFTATHPSDHASLSETLPLAGKWFSSKFPGATYASRLTDTDDLLGVFEVTGSSLLLRGVVSPTDGLTRTELSYTPAVTLLQFPLSVGASWTTQTTVSGLAQGVVSTYFENYQAKVDAAGDAKVPFGTFPALRVSLLLTRTVGALITTKRTYLWTAECFGTVAKAVSADNELNAEFATASELMRLAP